MDTTSDSQLANLGDNSQSAGSEVSITANPTINVTPVEVWANSGNKWWINYSIQFTGDSNKWYMIELWHNYTRITQTLYNFNGSETRTGSDWWGLEPAGTNMAYFRVYQQKGYNILEKATEELTYDSVTVHVQ